MAEKKVKKETMAELEAKVAALKQEEYKKQAKKDADAALKDKLMAAKRRKAMVEAHTLVCDADEVVKVVSELAHKVKHNGFAGCCKADGDLFKMILAYGRGDVHKHEEK